MCTLKSTHHGIHYINHSLTVYSIDIYGHRPRSYIRGIDLQTVVHVLVITPPGKLWCVYEPDTQGMQCHSLPAGAIILLIYSMTKPHFLVMLLSAQMVAKGSASLVATVDLWLGLYMDTALTTAHVYLASVMFILVAACLM